MSSLLKQLCNNFTKFAKISNVTNKINVLSAISKQYLHSPAPPTPYEIVSPNEDKLITEEIIRKVNNEKYERLFAIVHLAGKQFKITEGDVIIVEGYWPPACGDLINLDKVLVVGAPNFTLIGRPLVQNGLVDVHATVIEKTLSHSKVNFKKKRRKQFKKINFYRIPQTMLRINKVAIVGELNNPPDVSTKDRSFN